MASRMAKRQPGGGDVVVMVDCGLSGFVEGGRTVVAVYSNFLFATLARSWAEKGKAVDQLGISVVLLPRWCIHATVQPKKNIAQTDSQPVSQPVNQTASTSKGYLVLLHFCYYYCHYHSFLLFPLPPSPLYLLLGRSTARGALPNPRVSPAVHENSYSTVQRVLCITQCHTVNVAASSRLPCFICLLAPEG